MVSDDLAMSVRALILVARYVQLFERGKRVNKAVIDRLQELWGCELTDIRDVQYIKKGLRIVERIELQMKAISDRLVG